VAVAADVENSIPKIHKGAVDLRNGSSGSRQAQDILKLHKSILVVLQQVGANV
jgi:hypothetical protein